MKLPNKRRKSNLKNWAFLQKEVLGDKDDPYLVRWRILDTPWFNIWLHNIRRGDLQRENHSHPADFISIILAGGYTEPFHKEIDDEEQTVYRGSLLSRRKSIAFRKADWFHRIVIPEGQSCWSLILMGPKYREWGFVVDGKWVHNEEYYKEP